MEMMYEIFCRGKRVDNGEWAFGYYAYSKKSNVAYIIVPAPPKNYETFIFEKVIIETVGRYVGLTDRNDRKIFDGDIVKTIDGNYLVILDNFGGYHFELRKTLGNGYIKLESLSFYECEVIGNVFDNPELLEEGD